MARLKRAEGPFAGISQISDVLCKDLKRRRFYVSRYPDSDKVGGRINVSRNGTNYTVTGYVEKVGDDYVFKATGKNKDVFD
jgi:hypothetical protein